MAEERRWISPTRLKGTPFDPNSEAFFGQHDWSSVLALAMFGVLIALLVLAGVGKILRPAPDQDGATAKKPGAADTRAVKRTRP